MIPQDDDFEIETPEIARLRKQLATARSVDAQRVAEVELNAAIRDRRADVCAAIADLMVEQAEILIDAIGPVLDAQAGLERLNAIFRDRFTLRVLYDGNVQLTPDVRPIGNPLLELTNAFRGIFHPRALSTFGATLARVRAARERSQR